MKCHAAASPLLASVLVCNVSFAQTQSTAPQIVNVADMTCEALLKGRKSDTALMSMWLSGYYHGRNLDSKIDLKKYVENYRLLGRLCAKDVKQPVMVVIAKQVSAWEAASRVPKSTPPPAVETIVPKGH